MGDSSSVVASSRVRDSEEWMSLERHLLLQDGPSFGVVLVPDSFASRIVGQEATRLASALSLPMCQVRILRPESLLPALASLFDEKFPQPSESVEVRAVDTIPFRETKIIWVEGLAGPDAGSDSAKQLWSSAWSRAVARLNERRNALLRLLPGTLLLVGTHDLREIMADAAPDLWSIRSIEVELPSAFFTIPDAGTPESTLQHLEDQDGQFTTLAVGPDPELALAEAERLGDSLEHRFAKGRLFTRASRGFAARGRRAEALKSAQNAVEIFEALALLDARRFLPFLASSLTLVSAGLSAMGQRAAVSEPARRAVEIYEKLALQAQDDNPDAFLPELAMSFNNLANRLSEVGQRDAALESARRAVEIYEKLAEANPNAFLPDLARFVNSLALMLSDVGERDAALVQARHAVDICGQLAETNPNAFLPDLARSVNNLARMLSDVGEHDAALEQARRAVEIYEKLAEANPDAFLPNLAGSVNNLALMLADVGQRDAALEQARRTVEVYRQLANANPEVFLSDVARSTIVLSLQLATLGRLPEAREAAERALNAIEGPLNAYPGAHRHLGTVILGAYLKICQQQQTPPDEGLVQRIQRLLPPAE